MSIPSVTPSPQAAQGSISSAISSKPFKARLWSIDPLPNGFWAKSGRLTPAEYKKQGADAFRRFIFDDLRLQLSSTDDEWRATLTSPETFQGLLAALGPETFGDLVLINTTPMSGKEMFLIHFGALLSVSEDVTLGCFRLRPWLNRHFVGLAQCGLVAIRPAVAKGKVARKRTQTDLKEEWTTCKTALSSMGQLLISPVANSQTKKGKKSVLVLTVDPTTSLSPGSCKRRRLHRASKLREVKARSWAAPPEVAEPELVAPATMAPTCPPSKSKSPTPGPSNIAPQPVPTTPARANSTTTIDDNTLPTNSKNKNEKKSQVREKGIIEGIIEMLTDYYCTALADNSEIFVWRLHLNNSQPHSASSASLLLPTTTISHFAYLRLFQCVQEPASTPRGDSSLNVLPGKRPRRAQLASLIDFQVHRPIRIDSDMVTTGCAVRTRPVVNSPLVIRRAGTGDWWACGLSPGELSGEPWGADHTLLPLSAELPQTAP
ncbi:hypothetical protein B0H13DRAFT_2516139 [Mycena leptocephala]|nr:hypothetical protein B0H13DRAFT_2516139 [Mycena leptocephala]